MCQLIESIKVNNREFVNIEWHNKRFNESRREAFGYDKRIDISKEVLIPKNITNDVYKCRILYGSDINQVEFDPYVIRPIYTLKLVEDNKIDYHLKYANRGALSKLMDKRATADDILIVKNGCITDTSFSNIAFFDGTQWYTPKTYLLNGTKRQYLLEKGVVKEIMIREGDVHKYLAAKPINAMLDFDTTSTVKIL